jgi:phosphatidylglycerol---prolipoprotein diacylglyceryl transferase
MRPVLFRLGPFALHAYGTFLVAGLVLGTLLVLVRARRCGVRWDDVVALAAVALGGGLLGSFLLHVATRLPSILEDPSLLWRSPGMVFYGGLLGGGVACVSYARAMHLPLATIADLCAPAVPVGHAFGRVGCFFAGCCYGSPGGGPLAVHYPPGTPAAEAALAAGASGLHPVQLYEAAGLLALGALLLLFERRPRRRPYTLVLCYLVGYSLLRLPLETLRGDEIRGHIIPGVLSVSQTIALVVGATAAAALALRARRRQG